MGTITRKVYHDSPEYRDYSTARHFGSVTISVGPAPSGAFEFEGHRWKYEYTSFDDEGDFDVIYRFDQDGPDIAAENMTLFHVLLCNALAGLCSNASVYDDMVDDGRKKDITVLLAEGAHDIAMEAYNLVRSKL